jgi:Rad3-related DNA helicase
MLLAHGRGRLAWAVYSAVKAVVLICRGKASEGIDFAGGAARGDG